VTDVLADYAVPGPMTALQLTPDLARGLPADPVAMCAVVSGLVLHEFWAALYSVEVPDARLGELETRPASAMVELIVGLDPRPLSEPRPPERRMVGNCRHFSTLSCALLRRSGIAARARCGFATYFEAGRYVDHWIVEYWDPVGARWRRVDSQLDAAQREVLALDFDATDIPDGRFLSGGEAWELCRSGGADPEHFGILDFWGEWFVRNNAVRDLAALNKVELLPWDGWGLMSRENTPEDEELIDRVAQISASGNGAAARNLYQGNDRLRVPGEVTSYRAGTVVAVNV